MYVLVGEVQSVECTNSNIDPTMMREMDISETSSQVRSQVAPRKEHFVQEGRIKRSQKHREVWHVLEVTIYTNANIKNIAFNLDHEIEKSKCSFISFHPQPKVWVVNSINCWLLMIAWNISGEISW